MASLEALASKLLRGERLTRSEFELLWREAERRGNVVAVVLRHGEALKLDGVEVEVGAGGVLRIRAVGAGRRRGTRGAIERVEEP